MSRNSAELVGQVANLRPIVNRPLGALDTSQAGRLTIGRRFATCPTSSCGFPIHSEIPGDLRRSEACIAKRGRHHQFPLSPENAREIYSHDFEKLFRAADLTKSFEKARLADPQLEVYWKGVVKDWTEKSRYERTGRSEGKKKAQAMIDAIADPDHGVLQCIKTDW